MSATLPPAPPPPGTAPAIPTRAVALLVVLTLVWGTNWPLFPLAVREVSVWSFRAVAVLVAGLTLLAYARARGQSLAMALGAAAVGLLMLRSFEAYAQAPLGMALGLLSGIGWALGTLIIKRRPIGVTAAVLTGWQLFIAAVPIGAVAVVRGDGPWFMPSWTSVFVIAYIALVPMSIGNASWFAIVGLLPAHVAGLSSIMVPVVAMSSGAIVHGEPLGPSQWLAMACCAAALWLALVRPATAPPSPARGPD
jgi:drug/metabolite transporter (DMT)-like permease